MRPADDCRPDAQLAENGAATGGRCHTAAHGEEAPGQPVTGEEVRNVRFPGGYGYDRSEVDDLLNRIAAELDAGRPAGPLVQNALFQKRSWRAGYEWGAVDLFLEQLLVAERRCLQEIGEAGRDFGQQPGTRFLGLRTGIGRRELRTAEQQTVVSVRYSWLGWPTTLSAGGRTFTSKRVGQLAWRDIAGTISGYRPGEPTHMRPSYFGPQEDKKDLTLRQLLDETGTPILYTGGITSGAAHGYIKFPGHRWLQFPVQGTRRAHAIMIAEDQDGNEVAQYRLNGRTVQITVHQELTDELTLAIALSAPWLHSCFDKG